MKSLTSADRWEISLFLLAQPGVHSGTFLLCPLDSCCLYFHTFLLLLFSLSFKSLTVFSFPSSTLFFHLCFSFVRYFSNSGSLYIFYLCYFFFFFWYSLFLLLLSSSDSCCLAITSRKGRSEFNGIFMKLGKITMTSIA